VADVAQPGVLPIPPRNTEQARIDEKGRLKVPASYRNYLNDFPSKRVYVTSTDGHMARLYALEKWIENENVLANAGDDHEAAADLAFLAQHYGSETELDKEGRVLLPATLRRDLGLENRTVFLSHFRGRINIEIQEEYEERLRQARDKAKEKNLALEKRGFV
jgi:MraZ protein